MSTASKAVRKRWDEAVVPAIRETWGRHGRTLLVVSIIYMGVAAVGRLVYAVPILVSDVTPWGAIDLINRYEEVHRWFSGQPFYGVVSNGDYPPASYAMLWPLVGWLSLASARWLWAATLFAAAGVLCNLIVRESGASTIPQRVFAGLVVFAIYATQMNVLVGQIGLHVLAFLAAGLVWLNRRSGRWWEDLVAAALLVPALVKPTLSVPFFWILVFVPGRLRPAVLVVSAYAALSLLAVSFQDASILALVGDWIGQAGSQVTVLEGHTNVHKWLAVAGLEGWMLLASAVILSLHGWWTYRHRRVDFWLLLGVAALVARLWIHHRLYDDVLMIVPMVSLFRLAVEDPRPGGRGVMAGILLAATWATMHLPTWAFYDLSEPITVLLEVVQTVVWLAVLGFLVGQAQGERRQSAPTIHGE